MNRVRCGGGVGPLRPPRVRMKHTRVATISGFLLDRELYVYGFWHRCANQNTQRWITNHLRSKKNDIIYSTCGL